MVNIWALAGVILGGVAVAMQAAVNGALSKSMQAVLPAATVSFGVGFVVLLVVSLATGPAAFTKLPTIPWWQLSGGVLGAWYVYTMIFGVPQLGVVTAVAGLVLGQLVAALVIDATGAFGMVAHAISPARVIAVLLVGAGLILSRY